MQVIIITGASDGIGAELARQLARQHGTDARLVLAARNVQALEAVAANSQRLIDIAAKDKAFRVLPGHFFAAPQTIAIRDGRDELIASSQRTRALIADLATSL